ncbi:MAG: hypothetical protein RB296_05820 [Acidobacteriota bacterium]|jgi:hypothetical protein|nr:hypothetical protein [Acidobacteriota bacterium]
MTTKKSATPLYIALLLITLINMMLELLITRVFSVVAWYHFSFMAISIALFGMTAGAVYVHIKSEKFNSLNLRINLFRYTIYFALAVFSQLPLFLSVPFIPGGSIQGIASMTVVFAGISVPFFFAGVLVCVLLTKYISRISKLYFFDLTGAAFGCMLFVPLMDRMDPLSLILLLSGLAFLAALPLKPPETTWRSTLTIAILAILAMGAAVANNQTRTMRISWVRGQQEPAPPYERWNSFSRVIVKPYSDRPFGWGLSPVYLRNAANVHQQLLTIDSSAGTVLTRFDGDLTRVEHLKWDVTNLAHYLRKNASVAIIGAGGGRDILSALAFNQRKILGVEINHDVVNALVDTYGTYTGHLDRYPQVRLITDEARSYITRQNEKFDIIQSSLIDTYAASSSGAFALTENSLYTIEAWNTFLDHLSNRGILTFSRWWRSDMDGEMFRLTSLAAATLEQRGIRDVRRHMMLIRGNKTGNILLSPSPFTAEDEATITELCDQMQFQYVLGPTRSVIPEYEAITDPVQRKRLSRTIPVTLTPPSDNNPFFFQILKFSHLFSWDEARKYETNANISAIVVLFICLGIVIIFSAATIILPLHHTTRKTPIDQASMRWGILFFSMIGLAFMLVEISQLNVLSTFLGHPTYGLTTVLFSLLISSGLGSLFTQRIQVNASADSMRRLRATMLGLLGAILLYSLASPLIWTLFRSSSTPLRITVAVFMISLIGFFMGTAFPLGMKVAALVPNAPTQWYWGINGAMSVLSSVLATILSIMMGIQFTLLIGLMFYLLAAICLLRFFHSSCRLKPRDAQN